MSENKKEGLTVFETIRREDEQGREYWSARDLAKVLGYKRWDKFKNAIQKARLACTNAGNEIADHFSQVGNMVKLGSGAAREIEDVQISRYACYLVVENADPSKPAVALGQTYFATKARQQELMEEGKRLEQYDRLIQIDQILRGTVATQVGIIRAKDFSLFQDEGYKGLYAGEASKDIHQRKGLKRNEAITDYMGVVELASNTFRSAQVEAAIRNQKITDPRQANQINFKAGQVTRRAMEEISGTRPEELPTPTESIQKVKRKRLKQKPILEILATEGERS